MTQLLYPQGEIPWYPLDRRLGGPQSWSGRGGEEKNPQLLLELKSHIIQPVAQHCTTELSQLLMINGNTLKISTPKTGLKPIIVLRPVLMPTKV
jgi:hypothetical protein